MFGSVRLLRTVVVWLSISAETCSVWSVFADFQITLPFSCCTGLEVLHSR
jgi:hypothetical protein